MKMYEKHGLMSKLTDEKVLAYLRSKSDESHTQIVESALCRKLGIPPKNYHGGKGRKKSANCRKSLPVKVTSSDLIDHIISQKRLYGICYRHTIESAILNAMRSA